MDTTLSVLYVSAELAPLAKTGGLGDVANTLPSALHALGHDVRVALPCYRTIPAEFRGEQVCICKADLGSQSFEGAMRVARVPGTPIPLYLIENDGFYDRNHVYGHGGTEYQDNLERFSFFSTAVLDGVRRIDWAPDVVHCNDWHTALIPAYIKTRYARHPVWGGMPTVFTIHNLAYQGSFPASLLARTGLSWDLFTPESLEFHGSINLMKAAIAFASKLNTVSPRYAKEIQTPEYGHGLDGFLRTRAQDLSGILNGVDYTEWNPATDPHLVAAYSAEEPAGKAQCKAALQVQFDLPRRDVPLFAMVTRFDPQKGLDLVAEALNALLQRDIQLVMLGRGDRRLEQFYAESAKENPDKMRVVLRYDTRLAHQIQAGADFFLMPSHFEPGGLSQLYSLAYGTIPVVRATGGLADTVRDVSEDNLAAGRATGIVFRSATAEALLAAVQRALSLYRDPEAMRAVRTAAMKEDFSWEKSAQAYVNLYREAIAAP